MIPQIIHQIWEGKTESLPDVFLEFSETWKNHHTGWKYEFWDRNRMETFVHDYFPEIEDLYFSYRYDVQRWDMIRYFSSITK